MEFGFDFKIMAIAAIIPLVMGFIWYNPKVFGTAWMNSLGFKEEDLQGANMPLIFGLSYVFAFFLAMFLETSGTVIHQFGAFATLQGDETAESATFFNTFLENYGDRFRTFKHGALHGTIMGIFAALPILATNAMFERRSWKNIWINVGYWTVTLALMGGVICQFSNNY